MRENKIPSKTFLLGEYAVLQGGPALLLCSEPYFSSSGSFPIDENPFHAESAAGKFWGKTAKALAQESTKFIFKDPHQGRGGFGASGAEFVALQLAERGIFGETVSAEQAWEIWEEYRSLEASGSGVDVLAQSFASNQQTNSIEYLHAESRTLEHLALPRAARFFLLHTGKKLPTHEHLKKAIHLDWKILRGITEDSFAALQKKDLAGFAEGLHAYSKELESAGYLAPHSLRACEALRKITGVFAAKGCGAMGSDVVLALAEEKCAADIKKLCQDQGLELVARV